MKKTILLCVLLAQGLIASAQIFVEGVRLTPENTGQYVELDPMFKTDGSCTFSVDYGQSNPKEDFVSDTNGKRFDFRSLVDGLNYFYTNGWEVAVITVQEHSGRRFLLKRRF
jgi:hypothetical protein